MQLVVLGRDVTERREQERERERLLAAERTARREIEAAHARAALLAEVSAITERSLRLRSSLGEIAELVIRDLADVVAIDVIPRRGDQLERFAGGALDNATRRALQRTLGQAESFAERSATVEAARSGVPRWEHGDAARGLTAALGLGEQPVALEVAGLVPLIARGAVVGLLSLGWQSERGAPGEDERRARRRPIPADRVVDRQRAALRGARAGREHAADRAAPAAASACAGPRARRPLPAGRRGERGRR